MDSVEQALGNVRVGASWAGGCVGEREGPPFRADPRRDPDVQSYRIRLLLRVCGIEV